MKKFVTLFVALVIFGYIIYQNGSSWFLKLLTITTGTGAHTPSLSKDPMPPYKDGTYTGDVDDAYYGKIQVKAKISAGKIADVQFLQYPKNVIRSETINALAIPSLKHEAIRAQNAHVDIVSGATDTSNAFMLSLASALSQAK